MGLQDYRQNYKPFEYQEPLDFISRINKTYWIHDEVKFDGDLQDYHNYLTESQRTYNKHSMLMVSTVEVAVKLFWGGLYNMFPKPEINGLGVTFAECYKEGTEVLTRKGWTDFRNIGEDEVATFDSNRQIHFEKPSAYISKDYKGVLYKLSSKDQLSYLTPCHKLTLYNHKGEEYHEEAYKVSFNNSNIRIPVSKGVSNTELSYNKYITDWDRLRIAIQADGHKRSFIRKDNTKVYRGLDSNSYIYEIKFLKQRKIDRLQNILDNLPDIKYHKRKYKSGITCFEVFIDRKYNDLKSLEWLKLDDKITDPNWLLGIISELSYWDGSYFNDKKNCRIKYFTTNEENSEIVQMIGTLAGYKTNICTREDLRKESYNTVYVVSFNKNRDTLPITSLSKEEIEYDGKVYCVTIPSTGNLITRYNKKVFWSGNCEYRHAEAYSRLGDVVGYNDELEHIMKVPAVKAMMDFLNIELRSDDPFTKIGLFGLLVENGLLFESFATIYSNTRFKGLMKNVSNMVAWTSLDEICHSDAATWLLNTLSSEQPLSSDEKDIKEREFKRVILRFMELQKDVRDWIFEQGECDHFTKIDLENFTKRRIDDALANIGFSRIFNITDEEYEPMEWFDEEIFANTLDDFFAKRPVDYTKHDKPATGEDLF